MNKTIYPKEVTYSLRGVCMLMIILCHTYIHGKELTHPHYFNILQIRNWGMWASALFLYLSGYGMFFSIKNQGVINREYILNKVKKLILPFIYVWVVYLISFILFDNERLKFSLLFDFFTFAVPNAETWFYREIVSLYFISFIIFGFIKGNYKIPLIWGISIGFCLYCSLFTHLGRWWFNATLCFPLGMTTAWQIEKINKVNPWLIFSISGIALFVFTIIYRFDILSCIFFSISTLYLFSIANIHFSALSFVGVNSLFYYLLETPTKKYFSNMLETHNYYLYVLYTIIGITVLTYLYLTIQKIIKK